MLKHYVEYIHPGLVFSETSVREIPERDVSRIELPANSFGFRFFDRMVAVVDGETLTGDRKNVSSWHYQGEKLTLEQVKATYGNDGKYKILISNMENNGYTSVVKTKFGQFIPLKENDIMI